MSMRALNLTVLDTRAARRTINAPMALFRLVFICLRHNMRSPTALQRAYYGSPIAGELPKIGHKDSSDRNAACERAR